MFTFVSKSKLFRSPREPMLTACEACSKGARLRFWTVLCPASCPRVMRGNCNGFGLVSVDHLAQRRSRLPVDQVSRYHPFSSPQKAGEDTGFITCMASCNLSTRSAFVDHHFKLILCKDLTDLFERQSMSGGAGRDGGSGRRRCPTERGARRGAPSQDPGIMT